MSVGRRLGGGRPLDPQERMLAPVRAALAYDAHGVLPRAGGLYDQDFGLWREVEALLAGVAAEREARAADQRAALLAQVAARGR